MVKLPTKNLSTKVLSARVTPDVYAAWQSLAKQSNKSVSECLRDAVTMVDNKSMFKNDDSMSVPDEVTNVLGAMGGGTVIGLLLYKGIRSTLENSQSVDMSTDDVEAISTILAIAGALFVGTGIYKALK